jgi:dienelactone hydrolase
MMYALLPWYFVNRIGASYPRVKTFFEALRRANLEMPIGAAGFCWGGKHVVLLAGDKDRVDGKPLFDAGFTGHPSMLSMPGDIEKVELPVAFAIGDMDAHIPMDQIKAIKEIVENKPDRQKGEVKVYPNCGHGFCIRADTRFLDVMTQAAAAEDYCIEWFDKKFAGID